jgi:hypothetical protein
MTTQTTNSIQSKNLYVPTHEDAGKSLAAKSTSVKRTETGGNDLALWIENNRYVYDGIMNGTSDLPPADQEQFMQWWGWAMGQIQGSGWDPTQGAQNSTGYPASNPGQVLPCGAEPGPNGNAVFRTGTAETIYQATSMPVDVLSDEFTLNVPVKVQDITVEKTTDTRLNPPTEVIKITVKDPYSSPSETVYFIHEMDAKININTVGGEAEDVTLNGDFPNLTIGNYEEASEANPQASVEAEKIEGAENAYYYTIAAVGDMIDFRPQPGDNEEHCVVGGANISIPIDAAGVNVENSGPFTGPDGNNYDYKVTVTHKDGSTDTFYLRDDAEFTHNLNALSGIIQFNGVALEGGNIPDGFDSFTVNGGASSGSTVHPGDTPPVEVRDGTADDVINNIGPNNDNFDPTKVATYDAETVTVTANSEDGVSTHHDIAGRNVTINADSLRAPVHVYKYGNQYIIMVGDDCFTVDGNIAQSITINGGYVQLDSSAEGDSKIHIAGGAEGADDSTSATNADEMLETLTAATGGKTETQILNALNSAGFNFASVDALKEAINNGSFPPSMEPFDANEMQKLVNFVYNLGLINEINGLPWNHTVISPAYKSATQKIVAVLQALYPDANISDANPSASANDWKKSNNIMFNGYNFNWTRQTEGHQSEISISSSNAADISAGTGWE